VRIIIIRAVLSEPIFSDETAITDDCYAGQLQLLLAELDQFTNVAAFLWEERLPATEVYLHHSYNSTAGALSSQLGQLSLPSLRGR